MNDNQDKINDLSDKIDQLLRKQNDFAREINILKVELYKLQSSIQKDNNPAASSFESSPTQLSNQHNLEVDEPKKLVIKPKDAPPKPSPAFEQINRPNKPKSDLEKFIGENLLNKIGILVLIIGVAIGAKYSIENNLISPLTRIILGYLTGIVLLVIGIKLKAKFTNYSAVLVSGAMAVMYFITYAAYTYYELIGQSVAFFMMVIFTVFTVLAALNYNRQVIAHIGLVGAYATPFMLSDGSGNVIILLSYTTIINLGILIIAFKKYWKPLNYAAFGLTYLIYLSWFGTQYSTKDHFGISLFFVTVFFLTFYFATLAFKLLKNEKFGLPDIFLLLSNSFVFYGLGYFILSNHPVGDDLLGLFTLANAMLHLGVGLVIHRRKQADKSLYYFVVGLVVVFVTMAIPVQLDGNWVTLLWAAQAVLLFVIGRKREVYFYEKMAYPLVLLAFLSVIHDWETAYDSYILEDPSTQLFPVFNIYFFTSLFTAGTFGFLTYQLFGKGKENNTTSPSGVVPLLRYGVAVLFLATLYFGIGMEVANYWNQLHVDSTIFLSDKETYRYGISDYVRNRDLLRLKSIWLIIYSMIFISVLAWLNRSRIKNLALRKLNIGFLLIALIVFLIEGLLQVSNLRESYLNDANDVYYDSSIYHILIRYIAIFFAAKVMCLITQYRSEKLSNYKLKKPVDLIISTTILWIASSELIHWMDIAGSTQSYKFGLSLLWGVYAVGLVSIGIWKRLKHLRIAAMVLFGITLIKLFIYDLTNYDTVSKTIVFVSLGVLLLLISFLYNKYKNIIQDEA
jgi:uncharacterized membrane protein